MKLYILQNCNEKEKSFLFLFWNLSNFICLSTCIYHALFDKKLVKININFQAISILIHGWHLYKAYFRIICSGINLIFQFGCRILVIKKFYIGLKYHLSYVNFYPKIIMTLFNNILSKDSNFLSILNYHNDQRVLGGDFATQNLSCPLP